MTRKGRYWIVFWLLLFLGAAFIVAGRQNTALATAARLERLRERRLTLETRRAELEQRIREASSLAVLVPKVERTLGLRPAESRHYTILRLPAAEAR